MKIKLRISWTLDNCTVLIINFAKIIPKKVKFSNNLICLDPSDEDRKWLLTKWKLLNAIFMKWLSSMIVSWIYHFTFWDLVGKTFILKRLSKISEISHRVRNFFNIGSMTNVRIITYISILYEINWLRKKNWRAFGDDRKLRRTKLKSLKTSTSIDL